MANLLSTSVTGTVNSTGNMTAAGFTGNANVGGTGAATWHPNGIYAGSTQWLYGTMYKNGSGIYDAGEITTSSHGTSANWNTAYGWGNHAGLYAASSHTHDDRYYTETEINNFSYFRDNEDRTLKVLRFTGVGGDSGNSSNHSYAIYQGGGSWSHPYPDLHIGYHTGIKIGANTGYGGIRFYSDSDMATELFSVGNGSSDVRVSNNLSVGGTITGSNLSGTNTGDQTNISGNAATATNVAASGITGQTGMWTSAARPGAYRLYRNDDNSAYNVQTTWSADISGYWSLRGYLNDSYHAPCYVGYAGYASSAGGVAWSNVSSRPTALSQFSNDLGNYGGWITSSGSISGNAATATRTSGQSGYPHAGTGLWAFYNWGGSNGGTSAPTDSTYTVGISVGSNPGDQAYGFQIGRNMWNDGIWVRGYDSGWRSWYRVIDSSNIGSQSVSYSTNSGQLDGYGRTNYLGKSGNSYYQADTWIQLNGGHGLYAPSYYSAHFYPNVESSYTQWALNGNKSGYGGIYDVYSRVHGFMYDSAGNGGVYREANSLWYFYYHLGNNCMGVGTSTTSSSYKMYVDGTIYATGDVIAYSDSRKKTNIVTIDNALDKVLSMRGVFYDKIDELQNGRQVGVIAQEVNEILPEAVSYASDVDEYGVKYGNIVGVLIESIKEQQAQIAELKAEVKKLKGE